MNMKVVGGGPLFGWVIAQTNGVCLIGRRTLGEMDGVELSPVYALSRGVQINGPQLGVMCMAAPFLGLPSVQSIRVPDGAIFIKCEDLSGFERDELAKAVQQAEEIRKAMSQGPRMIAVAPGNALKGGR